ncbi:MAG TPA: NAD-dependent epimerase/dehydratase family protein [Candidatus Hydrogenedentes bacterium]|nr:NAD-dependent epimerase/dehydratase family protein [Candidatus Hydrogenedentota bacterium]
MDSFPKVIHDVEQLELLLSAPAAGLVEAMGTLAGDIMVLGVGGKMGPTLARMTKRASVAAGVHRRVIGVARFSSPELEVKLQTQDIETIRCDLLDQAQLDALPEVEHVVYMAGMKFGATGNESLTWAMNAYLPGMICQKFRHSRIAAFSTGNVYGVKPVAAGCPPEDAELNPEGEYAMSCLGRERIFEHFSRTLNIPMTLLRLNYACEMRYGVLVDLARKVWREQPVDVTMGYVNVIWQGDANAMALHSLLHVASPPLALNIAGPETLCVREVAQEFARRMNKPVQFTSEEAADALLSDGRRAHTLFGAPRVSAEELIGCVADWVIRGGETLGKPTHFEVRDGRF